MVGHDEAPQGIGRFEQIHVNMIYSPNGIQIMDFGDNDVTMIEGKNIKTGTSTGTKIGTAANRKIGFHDATPTIQDSAISDPASDTASNNAAIDSILAVLRSKGLIAT